MRLVNKLNSDAYQKAVIITDDGLRINFTIRYLPTQKLWWASFDDGSKAIDGICLLVSPNVLSNYKNTIQYGISCVTNDGQDPRDLTDFASGYARLYIMNKEEVEEIESEFFE